MVVSNTLQGATTHKIDKLYGQTWTETQKCTNLSQLSIKREKDSKFGTKLKLRDMLITKSMLIQEASF